jgi:hypothetical protein
VLPDGQGTITEFGPPNVPLGVQYRPTYSYTINRIHRTATHACREYLALLQRMVSEFDAAHP